MTTAPGWGKPISPPQAKNLRQSRNQQNQRLQDARDKRAELRTKSKAQIEAEDKAAREKQAAIDLFPPGTFCWNYVRKGRWPDGRVAGCCGGKIQHGQVVLAVPFFKFGEFQDSSLAHAKCLREVMDQLPLDRDDVQRKVKGIKNRYGIK